MIDYVNDKLPTNEAIKIAFREEYKMYPELAIREIIANALIHQDFREKGTGPTIEIFDDRIEIGNPGKPLIDTLRFIDHNPQSRNEKLASFMRRLKICEERGSGIDKVIYYIELFQLPAPEFATDDKFTKVTLYAYKPLQLMNKEDKIRATYQHCCLKYVSHEVMNNRSLRDRFNIESKNYSIASRIISDTIESGLIKAFSISNQARKNIKYLPIWA